MSISSNLDSALRHLRGEDTSQRTFDSLLQDAAAASPDFAPTEAQTYVLCHLASTAHDLNLSVMSEGGIGMSYHPDALTGIVPGDVVVGLFGANPPFILGSKEGMGSCYTANVVFVEDHCRKHPKLRDESRWKPEGTTEMEFREI